MTTPASPLSEPLAWNLVSGGYNDLNFEEFARYAADALALADVQPEHALLDVATGPGSLAIQAAARARAVHALDFSEAMLGHLRTRAAAQGLRNLFPQQGDGQALPYEDACFDRCFSMFGLIFFPDRARGFRELYRVLKPGGCAVVASWQPMTRVPMLMAVFQALAAELPNMPFGDGRGPLCDADAFQTEMEAAGFADVEVVQRVHAIEELDVDAFWSSAQKSLAPLVLLEHRMGKEAFRPVAEGIHRRLKESVSGSVRVEMPAWLGIGRKAQ